MRARHPVGALGSALVVLLATAAPALAGRVVATGHPLDRACALRSAPDPADGCQPLRAAVSWARGGAPEGGKPLLLLQRNDDLLQGALTNAWGGGAPPSLQSVDPSASYASTLPVDVTAYSAVIVASDRPDGNGVSVSPGLRSRLRDFFNTGGGIVLLGGSPDALLPVGVREGGATRPYRRTGDGIELGWGGTDCCDVLRRFGEPAASSALRVAERDATGTPLTVFGSGVWTGDRLTSPIALPLGVDDGPTVACQSRRRFRLHVRRLPGLRYRRVSIRVGTRKAQVLKGGRIRSVVDLRGLPKGSWTVRITAQTTDGQTFTSARRYRTCVPRKPSRRKHRL